MADKTLPELYTDNPVLIDPGDLGYIVENTGTTPAEGAYKLSQLMFNRYKISVTVSANDLIVALKHEDGADPSTDRPLYFKIGDSLRACTAALSKTLADGTNWFNAGSAELATKEVDYFVYAIWNTTGTDIVDLGFARVPYFSVYSDASGTTTNEKYLAYANASAPTSTDDMVNIARFTAILSAGAGYTWTVPTFTTANLVNRPTFETRWSTWTPTFTGFSANPTSLLNRYRINGRVCMIVHTEGSNGTSNATGFTISLPLSCSASSATGYVLCGLAVDNNALLASSVTVLAASASAITLYPSNTTFGNWTNSGGKRASFELYYEI